MSKVIKTWDIPQPTKNDMCPSICPLFDKRRSLCRLSFQRPGAGWADKDKGHGCRPGPKCAPGVMTLTWSEKDE